MKITFKVREDVYNLKRNDEFNIGGLLYMATEDFDVNSNSVRVCCYKDYPNGDFDRSHQHDMSADSIFLEFRNIPEMKVEEYFAEKF